MGFRCDYVPIMVAEIVLELKGIKQKFQSQNSGLASASSENRLSWSDF